MHWTYLVSSRIRNIYWWVLHRIHPKHRYNIIRTGLQPGYYDPSERVPAAVFEIISEYLDYTEDLVDWDSNDEHREAHKAFKCARHYWRNEGKEELLENDGMSTFGRTCLAQTIKHIGVAWYP